MTPPDEARVRAEFEAYVASRGWPAQSVPLSAQDCYLAAARHYSNAADRERDSVFYGHLDRINLRLPEQYRIKNGEPWVNLPDAIDRHRADLRAEADDLRAELSREQERIRSFQDGYHAIAAALGTTVPETNDEDLVDRIERLLAERDARAEQVDSLQQLLDEIKARLGGHCTDETIVGRIRALQASAGSVVRFGEILEDAESALPSGFKVDAEHSLADRVRELAETRVSMMEYAAARKWAIPSPLTAARDAVVEAAMGHWNDGHKPPGYKGSLWAACSNLDALQQQADDPVREARDFAQIWADDLGVHPTVERADIACAFKKIAGILTRALDRKERR